MFEGLRVRMERVMPELTGIFRVSIHKWVER